MADKKKKAQPKRKRVEKEKEPERRSTRQAKAPARFAEGEDEEKLSTRKQAAKEVREKAAKKAKVEKAKKKKEEEEKKKKKDEEEEEEEDEEDEEEQPKQLQGIKGKPQSKSDTKGKGKPPVEEEEDDDGEEKDQQAEEDKDDEAEDDEEDGDIDAEALAEHQKKAPKHAKKAVQNFKKGIEVFTWKSSAKKNYILLCKTWRNGHGNDDVFESDDWPLAFVGNESQPVAAALYEINDKGTASILVAIWTVSLSGDESSQFYLGPAQDAVFEFAELIDKDEGKAFLGDKFEDCRDSLGISSGDEKVKKFYCPSLESLNALELKK